MMGKRTMDLSLLYFIFPRLSERRRVLAKEVCLDRAPVTLSLKRKLQPKRDRQVIRITPKDRSFIKDARESLRVTGITTNGDVIHLSWRETGSRQGADFELCSKSQLQRIEVSSTQQRVVKISWVNATSTY